MKINYTNSTTESRISFIMGLITLIIILMSALSANAQPPNDNCASAVTLTHGTSCVFTAGTNTAATQQIAPSSCSGYTSTTAKDVWYTFTAAATAINITVTSTSALDPVVELRTGACTGALITCIDATAGANTTESINYNGLAIGTTYKIRVYGYETPVATGTFNICISYEPNDNCANAVSLTHGTSCVYTAGKNTAASQSLAPSTCSGFLSTSAKDVWFSFTAATTSAIITVASTSALDPVIELRSGPLCNGTFLTCIDATSGANSTEILEYFGLTIGNTYFIRVYGFETPVATGTFNICVRQIFVPGNDCITNATNITSLVNAVSTSNPVQCTYNFDYNVSASTVDDPTRQDIVGDPNGCNGVDVTLIPRPAHYDIWYKFTVTAATPNAYLQLFPNTGTAAILAMALYSGTPNTVCPTGIITGLTQVDCSVGEVTDVPPMNIPGGARDKAICSTPIHPRLNVGGLSPGTYYLRVWDFGGFNPPYQGTFNLCAESTDPRPNTVDACPSSANIGYLGTSRNVDVNTTYTGLSNAGATGNAYGAVSSNPLLCTGANANEPLLGATPAGDARLGCAGGWLTYVGGVNNIMNVTVIHAFTVNACGPGCEPVVTVRLNNIVSEGLPGNAAQLQVMAPGNCTGSTQTVMNAISNVSCIEMRPAGNAPLVNGTYYIVVDGQDGQLLEYDLTLTLTYPCPVDTDAAGQPCLLPLPVALTTFSARHEDEGNVLEWETASEINNAYFQIERSTDVKSFSVIGQMAGAGNSTTVNAYTFTDRNPGTAKNYYRLKQVDFNGKVTYSKIILISSDHSALEITSLAPNPAKDKIEISLAGNTQNLRTDVINMVGRTVMSYDSGIKNYNPLQLDISNLEQGYYIVKITDTVSGEIIVRNFVKQ